MTQVAQAERRSEPQGERRSAAGDSQDAPAAVHERDRAEVSPAHPTHQGISVEARTTASTGPSCAHCGGPVTGRRRNGYCSDRCRMAAKRAEEAALEEEALRQLERAVVALRTFMRRRAR